MSFQQQIFGRQSLTQKGFEPKKSEASAVDCRKELYDGIVAIINGMLAASVSEILNVSCIVSCMILIFYKVPNIPKVFFTEF